MPDDEKIIYFPGCEPGGPRSKGPLHDVADVADYVSRGPQKRPDLIEAALDNEAVTELAAGYGGHPAPAPAPPPPEIEKALGIILSGTPFVIVGVRPTGRGADFVSTAFGDKEALQNALPHLADMQGRALSRYGIR